MSLEAEQATVGAAIASASQYDAVSEIVSSGDFLDPVLKCIWDATAALREAGRDVDEVILSAMLDRSSRWQAMGQGEALGFVASLLDLSHSFKSSLVYAGIIREASMTRKILEYCENAKEVAHSGELDADQKLGEIHTMLDPLTEGTADGFVTAKEAAHAAVVDIMAQMERGDALSGLSTGFEVLDDITAGLQDSDLIYVGARPSMGKTVFGLGIAAHVAKTDPVLVFSIEMPKEKLMKRLISAFASINADDIRKGNIEGNQHGLLIHAGKQVAALNMRIDDTSGLSVDQLRTRARIAARKERPRLILIDYLTLLSGKGDNRTQEVGYISRSLKGLAKEMGCPVMCLAQLNRGLEQRADKRPMLSDLRDSGEIEQDADVVMFLYRDEVYDENSDRAGIVEVDVAKQRDGETGVRLLASELQYQRFTTLTKVAPPIKKQSNAKPLAGVLGGNAAVNDPKGYS